MLKGQGQQEVPELSSGQVVIRALPCGDRPDDVCFEVVDSGIGIDPAMPNPGTLLAMAHELTHSFDTTGGPPPIRRCPAFNAIPLLGEFRAGSEAAENHAIPRSAA